MYKVLDEDGKQITVDKIDKKIHKHLSGREFTSDDNVRFISVIKKAIPSTKETTKPLASKKSKTGPLKKS